MTTAYTALAYRRAVKMGYMTLIMPLFMGGLGLDILTCIGNSTTIASAIQRYDWCPQNVNDLREPATSLSGMLRHRWARFCWARFCYDQLIYVTKIWILCLHPLQIYDSRYKMWKMGWFGVVNCLSRSVEFAPFHKVHTSSYWWCVSWAHPVCSSLYYYSLEESV